MVRTAIMGRKFWHKQTKERQDLFVYDKRFFDKMDKALKADSTPCTFQKDFPEVYLYRVEKKNQKLIQKKMKVAQAGAESARSFKVMMEVRGRLARAHKQRRHIGSRALGEVQPLASPPHSRRLWVVWKTIWVVYQ